MPRVVDHAQRRAEIAQTVWEIIATDGIGAVTLRTIAARGGVSMGRIQHYFPTRDAIVQHALRALIDAATEANPVPAAPSDTLRMLLTHAVPHTEAQRLGSKVWYAYLAEAITDPEIAAIVGEALQGGEDLATTTLDGDRARARALLAAADGFAYRTLVGVITAQEAGAAIDALLAAPAARPEVTSE
ncbi:TetR/AcrR family transcriptional regulator [Tsukamurella sp. PLM1]|uniref:TetR/AcrR family transcriptional regulator n=1 Tax=Tsukamurella sp. PLM1 TaxID=2929795 RepID=UPI002054D7FC|nr:TetR family transcriptional regulator [Tsukamurella sp. PLM1]BDH56428.1 hypothetical protein MTP03_13670 [Tsukamurella sp. PLM1]